eukprot:4366977-Pyramimonas_sp.AAC.1
MGRPRARGRRSRLVASAPSRSIASTRRGSCSMTHGPVEGLRAGRPGDHPGPHYHGGLPEGAAGHGADLARGRAALHARRQRLRP